MKPVLQRKALFFQQMGFHAVQGTLHEPQRWSILARFSGNAAVLWSWNQASVSQPVHLSVYIKRMSLVALGSIYLCCLRPSLCWNLFPGNVAAAFSPSVLKQCGCGVNVRRWVTWGVNDDCSLFKEAVFSGLGGRNILIKDLVFCC